MMKQARSRQTKDVGYCEQYLLNVSRVRYSVFFFFFKLVVVETLPNCSSKFQAYFLSLFLH